MIKTVLSILLVTISVGLVVNSILNRKGHPVWIRRSLGFAGVALVISQVIKFVIQLNYEALSEIALRSLYLSKITLSGMGMGAVIVLAMYFEFKKKSISSPLAEPMPETTEDPDSI